MSMGEQDEARWLDRDEAVRIEILAAEYAAELAVHEGPSAAAKMMPSSAYDGWATHRNHQSPVIGRWSGVAHRRYMAGWLARQIWCTDRGDDSEQVDRRWNPGYVPHNAAQMSQMEKLMATADSESALGSITMMFTLDLAFHREDIVVAMGRVERAKGWK